MKNLQRLGSGLLLSFSVAGISYKSITCNLSHTRGIENIYITFKGSQDDLCHLDWFKFDVK